MRARGFPARWVQWIGQLLSTASSRIVINGDETTYFHHKKGLRQGDPLSPMLFNMAVDVLQRMIAALNTTLRIPIVNKLPESVMAFPYADDTAIIASTDTTTLVSLKLGLRMFMAISGLEINYKKSTWIPINVRADEIPINSTVLGCKQSNFSVTYSGMPLAIKKPARDLFMSLLEKFENKLELPPRINRNPNLLYGLLLLASVGRAKDG